MAGGKIPGRRPEETVDYPQARGSSECGIDCDVASGNWRPENGDWQILPIMPDWCCWIDRVLHQEALKVRTRNINLTTHYDRFVDAQITAGTYSNASEVLRAGLRLLEQQTREDREKLALLRSLAAEAFEQLDQGKGIEIRDERQLTGLIRRLGHRAAKPAKRRRNGD
jgi:antitoxin ParD1/3/4